MPASVAAFASSAVSGPAEALEAMAAETAAASTLLVRVVR
jgi:hypothetical protein